MTVPNGCLFLIFTWLIPMVFLQNPESTPVSSSSKGLGKSSCFVLGNKKETTCGFEPVDCTKLPDECTSLIWSSVVLEYSYDIKARFGKEDDEFLKELLACSKVPVYIYYGFKSVGEWSLILACNGANGENVKDEAKALIAFLKEHQKLQGIILQNLDVIPQQTNIEDFGVNFKSYVTNLKKAVPNIEVGAVFYADEFKMHFDNPVVDWIDFKDTLSVLDFVLISFYYFNPCGKDFIRGGIAPVTGNAKYTIQKMQDTLDKAEITKDKLYFLFSILPDEPSGQESDCFRRLPEMCICPKEAVSWCANTIASFHEKGVFAGKHTSGFVAWAIDGDDIHGDCKCDCPFPAFHAILDGFDQKAVPASCPLLDRC